MRSNRLIIVIFKVNETELYQNTLNVSILSSCISIGRCTYYTNKCMHNAARAVLITSRVYSTDVCGENVNLYVMRVREKVCQVLVDHKESQAFRDRVGLQVHSLICLLFISTRRVQTFTCLLT